MRFKTTSRGVELGAEFTGNKWPTLPPVTLVVRHGDSSVQTYLTADEARWLAGELLDAADEAVAEHG